MRHYADSLASSSMRHSVPGRLVAGMLSALILVGCAKPLKILEISDLHVLDEASTEYPRKVIEAMNAEGGDLVLVCGDVATDGRQTELELAKGVLDQLDAPYHPVLGNHDAEYPGTREETLFKRVFGLESNSYHFVTRGIHFVAFDPGCGTNFERPATAEALARLREMVERIPDHAPIILFSHYPFAKGVRHESPSRREVLAAFSDKKLLAVIGGHFHGNTALVQDGVLFTTTACASSTRGNHDRSKAKGFRVFHVDRLRRITTEFREVR